MLTIKDDSLRYYTISYAIFNQLSYLINSSGQMLSECLTMAMCVYGGWWGGVRRVGQVCMRVCVWVGGGWGANTHVMGKRRRANLKHKTSKNKKKMKKGRNRES